MKPVEEMLRNYIADNILFSKGGYPYPDEASFLEKGIVDSTNILELVMFIEEQFGISTEDNEIVPANFDSISNLSRFTRGKLESKLEGKKPTSS